MRRVVTHALIIVLLLGLLIPAISCTQTGSVTPTPFPTIKHNYTAEEATAVVKEFLYSQAYSQTAKRYVSILNCSAMSAGDYMWDACGFRIYEKSGAVAPTSSVGNNILHIIAIRNEQ